MRLHLPSKSKVGEKKEKAERCFSFLEMQNLKNYQKTDIWFRDKTLERNYRTEKNVKGQMCSDI